MLQNASLKFKFFENPHHYFTFVSRDFLCISRVRDWFESVIRQFDILEELIRNVFYEDPLDLEESFPHIIHGPVLEDHVFIDFARHFTHTDESSAPVHREKEKNIRILLLRVNVVV